MPRRIMQGNVISAKADKTAIVSVERRVLHPLYKKVIRRSKKYAVHDPENSCKEGQVVRIRECSRISKHKRWEIYTEENSSN